MVEHWIEDPGVVGSSPTVGTNSNDMKKKDIVEFLKTLDSLSEDEEFTLCEGELKYAWQLGIPELSCGKRQEYMPYYCVRKPNHEGECYCSCKNVDFIPD